MEIQKVFSSLQDEERLYTILLTEDEAKLYSIWLEQREYVSKRQAKKLAKKALEAEQVFQDNINKGVDSQIAQETYNKAIGKVQSRKNAGKVLKTTESGVMINPIKNDRAAEQIAGAIGDGMAETKEKLANQLKKSKGGKGIDTAKHVASGEYNPQGVKEGVVKAQNTKKVDRSRVNSANKRAAEAENRARVAQQKAEAATRKAQAQAQ